MNCSAGHCRATQASLQLTNQIVLVAWSHVYMRMLPHASPKEQASVVTLSMVGLFVWLETNTTGSGEDKGEEHPEWEFGSQDGSSKY